MANVTVTGKLESSMNDVAVIGAVDVMLCGYGSRVPRISGRALVARITDGLANVNNDGTFSFNVPPNDQIVPAGTYYTVTIRDDNGDISQVNAYRFTSDHSTYDLNLIDPYDPNLPPPPLPDPVTNNLQIVALNGSSWDCDGADFLSFKIIATQDGLIDIQYVVPGNLYTFIVQQDTAGNHAITWAGGINNATEVDPRANVKTVQTFVSDENGQLWAIGPAGVF